VFSNLPHKNKCLSLIHMEKYLEDSNKEKQKLMNSIKTTFNAGNFEACYKLIADADQLFQLSIDFLLYKMKTLEKLGKFEEALNTCNMILFLQPLNSECHQLKISILKNLQQYYNLSESLVQALKFHPHLSFNS